MINNGSSCIHIFVHIQLLNLISILTRTPIVTQLFAQPAPDQGFPLPNIHFIMQPGGFRTSTSNASHCNAYYFHQNKMLNN